MVLTRNLNHPSRQDAHGLGPSRDPHAWVVEILVASIPFAGWSLFNIGQSFAFTASYVICLGAIVLAIFIHLSRRWKTRDSGALDRSFHFMVGAFVISISLSIIPFPSRSGANPQTFLFSSLHLAFFLTSLWAFVSLSKTKLACVSFFNAYIFSGMIVSLFGIIQIYYLIVLQRPLNLSFNIARLSGQAENSFLGLFRIASVFVEPGWFAHFNTQAFIVTTTWFIPSSIALKSRGRIIFFTCLASIFFFLILATLSASALVVGACTLVFALWIRGYRFKQFFKFSVIVTGVILLSSLITLPNDLPNPATVMVERMVGLATGQWVSGESAESRGDEIEAGKQLLIESNLLGIGYGQSTSYILRSTNVGTLGISNFYALLLAEVGIPGLIFILASLIFFHIRLAIKQRRHGLDSELGRLVFTARCCFFADCLFLNFFGNFASAKYVSTLWLVLVVLQLTRRNATAVS